MFPALQGKAHPGRHVDSPIFLKPAPHCPQRAQQCPFGGHVPAPDNFHPHSAEGLCRQPQSILCLCVVKHLRTQCISYLQSIFRKKSVVRNAAIRPLPFQESLFIHARLPRKIPVSKLCGRKTVYPLCLYIGFRFTRRPAKIHAFLKF